MRLAAISVDLDEIDAYRSLYGLGRDGRGRHAVYDRALERFEALASEEGVPLTWFVVGRDLERPESARHIAALVRAGHQVENHSYAHRYDLGRLGRGAVVEEIARGAARIAEVTGRRPEVFRAPGYAASDAMLDALEELGVRFDSSLLPSPGYWLAKLGALAVLGTAGRRSHAVVHAPATLLAPTSPYRPGRPFWRRGARPLLELPISVTRGARLPFIGTSITLAGERGARWLARGCAGAPLVNLELHGIDLLDAGDGVEDLARVQPGVGVPVARKRAALGAALGTLRAAGYAFVTLVEAAERILSEAA
jgi:peptidoglycan/xylan/chitin deacetylase (PgdA/CDA1 family)